MTCSASSSFSISGSGGARTSRQHKILSQMEMFKTVFVLFLIHTTTSFPLDKYDTETSQLRRRRFVANPFVLDPTPGCYLQFFSASTPPQGLPYAPSNIRFICQKLPDTEHTYFATMFDQEAGNAVFSAYTVTAAQGKNIGTFDRTAVSNSWRTEPGLKNQGSNKMYYGHGTGPQGFAKGHLNPAHLNSFGKMNVRATFTYTNAVPQYGVFNSGQWAVYEKRIANYVQEKCATKDASAIMYLLTGTSLFRLQVGAKVPTQDSSVPQVHNFPSDGPEAHIVRPNSLWTAGCCIWTNPKTGNVEAQSLAVMSNNEYDKTKIQMTSLLLKELEALLTANGDEPANLFPSTPKCRDNSFEV